MTDTLQSMLAIQPLGTPVSTEDAAVLITGKDGAGNRAPLALEDDQVKTADLALRDGVGAPDDAPASSDTADASLIALERRLLQYLSGTINNALGTKGIAVVQVNPIDGTPAALPTAGQTDKLSSTSVVLATDDPLVTLFGTKTDAKDAATDGTAISVMSVLKQISGSIQALASATPADPTFSAAVVNVSSSGQSDLIASSGSTVIKVYELRLYATEPVNVTLKTGTNTVEVIPFSGPGSFVLDLDANANRQPHYIGASGEAFTITTDATVQIHGRVRYTQA